ncbi:MAG: helix-turn-helix domain-containing protein [Cyclobacteriaceae bacterium]
MDKTILISLPVEHLQTIVFDSVNECLKLHKPVLQSINQENDLIDINEASKYLGLATATIYSKVSGRTIPHSKIGKKLFFSKKDLATWIKSGQRKTVSDLETEANSYVKSKTKK